MSTIGRGMPRARSMEEFVHLVKDALFEIEDVKDAFEFDSEFMDDTFKITEAIEPELKALLLQLQSDGYDFPNPDLRFMANMHLIPQEILPYKPLLTRINETHTKGLEETA